MNIFLILMAAVVLTGVSFGYSRCRHPVITAAKNSISGVSAMLLVNILSGYTGCYIAINAATVFVASVLSLPGVVCLLIMKIIFNY